MLHRVRFKATSVSSGEVYIDEKKMSVSSMDVRFRVNKAPSVQISLSGFAEMDIQAALDLSDEEVLLMVSRRMKDEEFISKMIRMINNGYRV